MDFHLGDPGEIPLDILEAGDEFKLPSPSLRPAGKGISALSHSTLPSQALGRAKLRASRNDVPDRPEADPSPLPPGDGGAPIKSPITPFKLRLRNISTKPPPTRSVPVTAPVGTTAPDPNEELKKAVMPPPPPNRKKNGFKLNLPMMKPPLPREPSAPPRTLQAPPRQQPPQPPSSSQPPPSSPPLPPQPANNLDEDLAVSQPAATQCDFPLGSDPQQVVPPVSGSSSEDIQKASIELDKKTVKMMSILSETNEMLQELKEQTRMLVERASSVHNDLVFLDRPQVADLLLATRAQYCAGQDNDESKKRKKI
ncbi:hypothetical protein PAPYR_4512 [Paratrimastix pyriformis]|uniref:Uncharacterized protein n=1 Tax=Paratrimastix pyriformis TaxID=342808 RepID=A0ABQ8UJR0_9EUKA|nr:hypothetical protein PAPYR_4512 [Paratrimastix pyriformis]